MIEKQIEFGQVIVRLNCILKMKSNLVNFYIHELILTIVLYRNPFGISKLTTFQIG